MVVSEGSPVREGDLLAGKYRVERVLGAGGMGVVVAARHEQLDQLVAVKFIRDGVLSREDAIERFLREARAVVRLKSEHVARVLDAGVLDSGAPYMVMEFLEGSDLGKVLAEEGPLPVAVAADWALQACEALAEAHAAGIVHRDLKPENLFLARTAGGGTQIKVLDFGVSKSINAPGPGPRGLTQTRAMIGSPLYMAPEQLRSSRDVDPRADVWALGVVLFELLTAKWPFEAETMPDLCVKVVSEPPQSLAGLRPDVPRKMADLIEKCLEKDPAKRFGNAAEVASALEPMAPPGSRFLAERARQAIASGVPGELHRTPSGQTTPPNRVTGEGDRKRRDRTPSAWGSGRGTRASLAALRRSPSWKAGIAAVLVGALGVGLLMALRAAKGSSSLPPDGSSSPSVATQAPPPSVVAAPPPTVAISPLGPSVVDSAQTPSADAIVETASPVRLAGVDSGESLTPPPPHAEAPARGSPARGAPSPKVTAQADDIPPFR